MLRLTMANKTTLILTIITRIVITNEKGKATIIAIIVNKNGKLLIRGNTMMKATTNATICEMKYEKNIVAMDENKTAKLRLKIKKLLLDIAFETITTNVSREIDVEITVMMNLTVEAIPLAMVLATLIESSADSTWKSNNKEKMLTIPPVIVNNQFCVPTHIPLTILIVDPTISMTLTSNWLYFKIENLKIFIAINPTVLIDRPI